MSKSFHLPIYSDKSNFCVSMHHNVVKMNVSIIEDYDANVHVIRNRKRMWVKRLIYYFVLSYYQNMTSKPRGMETLIRIMTWIEVSNFQTFLKWKCYVTRTICFRSFLKINALFYQMKKRANVEQSKFFNIFRNKICNLLIIMSHLYLLSDH